MTEALSLAAWQIRYEQRAFWRNRRAAVLSFAFPLMLFLIFTTINEDQHISSLGGIPFATFYLPGIMAYAIVVGSFSNLLVTMTNARDSGVLKRVQGTPLPWWAFLVGRIGSAVVVTFATTALLLVIGTAAFGVDVRASTLPAVALGLVLGTACFTALGIGMVRFIPNAETAGPLQAVIVMPIAFISNMFFPLAEGWLTHVANLFPLKPLADLLHNAFDPAAAAPGVVGKDVLALVIWTAIGAAMMVRFLRSQARAS
jgi:ABC-2 type transport system permease protein